MSRASFAPATQQMFGFNPQETVRQCCEKIISFFLVVKEQDLRSNIRRRRQGNRREIRAAVADGQRDVSPQSLTENSEKTVDVPTLTISALPDVVGSRQADSQDLSLRTTSVLGSNISHTADAHRQALPPAAERLWPRDELNHTGNPQAASLGTGRSDNGDVREERANEEARAHSTENAHEHYKEGDLEHEQTHSEGDAQPRSERIASEPVEPSDSELAGPPLVKKGFPKVPRTDEAVWAAAALGSLLVLLALAVLHTRMYRHWRTTPSLYWYDPQRDYESVAGEDHFLHH